MRHDNLLIRPAEVDLLFGDSSKARCKAGWEPKVSLDQLVKLKADHNFALAKREANAVNSIRRPLAKRAGAHL